MLRRHLLWLPALLSVLGGSASPCPDSSEATRPLDAQGELTTQFMRLNSADDAFVILVEASADLYNLPAGLSRAVIVLGPGLDPRPYLGSDTLVLLPVFLEPGDPRAQPDMPVWQAGEWIRGERSGHALSGVCAFSVVDGLLRYLDHHSGLAQLRDVDLLGRGPGAELLRRYAVNAKEPGRYRLHYRVHLANE